MCGVNKSVLNTKTQPLRVEESEESMDEEQIQDDDPGIYV